MFKKDQNKQGAIKGRMLICFWKRCLKCGACDFTPVKSLVKRIASSTAYVYMQGLCRIELWLDVG